jgi:hypothetical protein
VVQDSVIWRLSGFTRHAIAILGHGTPVNYPSASFESEARAAEEHWSAGRLAVFCDLSNCIRTGDLAVFDPSANTIQVVEVKESDDAMDKPQMRRAEIRVDYLNLGRSDELADDAPLVTAADKPRLKTHIAVLRDVLTRARRDGWAASRLGEGTAVYGLDGRASTVAVEGAPARWQRYEARFGSRLGRAWKDAPLYLWNSSDRVLRDETHSVAGVAPFSVFPLEPADCAALALGITGYRSVLNLWVLDAALRRVGLRRTEDEPGQGGTFIWVEGRDARLRVPGYLAEQLLVETLTFAAFAEAVASAFNEVATAREAQLHVGLQWADEARVWR